MTNKNFKNAVIDAVTEFGEACDGVEFFSGEGNNFEYNFSFNDLNFTVDIEVSECDDDIVLVKMEHEFCTLSRQFSKEVFMNSKMGYSFIIYAIKEMFYEMVNVILSYEMR